MAKKVTKKTSKKKVNKKVSKTGTSRKAGNPTKFDENLIPVIKNLLKRGMIIQEVTKILGIDESTG